VADLAGSLVIAKFHYTDPTGPARTQRSFTATKVRAGPVGSVSGPCRVRVVEFSSYPTTCTDFVRVGSGPCRVRVVEFSFNEFQVAGPATEKARRPNVERRCRGTNSWWQPADRRCIAADTYRITLAQTRYFLYFTRGWNMPKLPLSLRYPIRYPDSQLKHGLFGPPESTPRSHLDWFSRFCTAHDNN